MNHPTIIQGGMGVAVSSWPLARAVAQLGQDLSCNVIVGLDSRCKQRRAEKLCQGIRDPVQEFENKKWRNID